MTDLDSAFGCLSEAIAHLQAALSKMGRAEYADARKSMSSGVLEASRAFVYLGKALHQGDL